MTIRLHALRLLLILLTVLAPSPALAGGERPEARELEHTPKLLPQRPTVPVRIIDPDLAADAEAIRRLDAFLVREPDGRVRRVIYLNRRSAVLENAIRGRDIDIAILAAVIRHEQEHLAGAGETDARRVEREFFQRLVFTGEVPVDSGLAYLAALAQRRPDREPQ
jgi:hypothetical protein